MFLIVLTLALLPMPAYAYLDPATGSIILQSIIGGMAVFLGLLKMYWTRVKEFCGRLTGKDNAPKG